MQLHITTEEKYHVYKTGETIIRSVVVAYSGNHTATPNLLR